jgi:hypothetical protein
MDIWPARLCGTRRGTAHQRVEHGPEHGNDDEPVEVEQGPFGEVVSVSSAEQVLAE